MKLGANRRKTKPPKFHGLWGNPVTVPDGIQDEVAARAYINPLTALILAAENPIFGKTVLLTGASTFCGMLLIQMARWAGAGPVLALIRSPQHKATLEALGAKVLVAKSGEDASEVLRPYQGLVDIVFDAVGGVIGDIARSMVCPGGRHVLYGLLSGTPLSVRSPFRVTTQFFWLRKWIESVSSGIWHDYFRRIFDLLMAEQLALPPATRFRFADIGDGLRFFEASPRLSKPILIFS